MMGQEDKVGKDGDGWEKMERLNEYDTPQLLVQATR
jgi:hypothetical protein